MLDQAGHKDSTKRIYSMCRNVKQTMLCSATYSKIVEVT